MMELNWIAVVVAAIVKFVIGSVWYTALFGQQYRRLVGVPEGSAPTGLGQALAVQFVCDLVMAYILARFIIHYAPVSFGSGLLIGFMAWVGFVAAVTIPQVFYEKRPWALWLINAGYLLVGLLVMGAILGIWHAGETPAPPSTP